MGVNGAASPPHRRIELKSSGAGGATRQHSVNPANAAFKGCRKIYIPALRSITIVTVARNKSNHVGFESKKYVKKWCTLQ